MRTAAGGSLTSAIALTGRLLGGTPGRLRHGWRQPLQHAKGDVRTEKLNCGECTAHCGHALKIAALAETA